MPLSSSPDHSVHRIVVLDSDPNHSRRVLSALLKEGFAASLARDAGRSIEYLLQSGSQLLLVNLPLPGLTGVELCRLVGQYGLPVRIIFLAASGDELDKVLLLEMGADDYLVKPYGIRELIARIKALLRRTFTLMEGALSFGEVRIDTERKIINRAGGAVKMTPIEFRLLIFLVSNRNRALTRELILRNVWGHNQPLETRTPDVYVVRLRRKLESEPNRPRHLLTIHGVGYRFVTRTNQAGVATPADSAGRQEGQPACGPV
jgi:DNA-binding response OmpR family regulator